MSVINTNVKSLVAQNAISGNNNRLSTAMQRLSTGLRINSAADDAAGLAIGTRMTAQARGLNMAIKNANDGISLLQTAEGAMDEVTNMVQRIRELAVQSATDTVTASDRADMNKEVKALQKEINRIASTTQFNGFNILDGSFQKKMLQIGDKAGVSMEVSLQNISAGALGQQALAKGTMVSGRVDVSAALAGNVIINGTSIQAVTANNSSPAGATPDIKDVVSAINASNVGVTASAYNEVVARNKGTGVSLAGEVSITVTALDTGEDTVINLGDTTSLQDMVDQINAQGGESTVLARINDDGKLALYNNSGASITIADTSTAISVNGVDRTATGFETADITGAFGGFLKLDSTSGQNFSIEFTDDADATTLAINKVTPDGNVVGTVDMVASAPTIDKATWLSGSMYINGVDIWNQSLDMQSGDDLVNAINGFTDKTGVTAGLTTDGFLTLKSGDGSPIQVRLSEDFQSSLGIVAQNVGAADYDENSNSQGTLSGGPSVGTANVLSQATASSTITVMDKALDQISGYRADIGATINRLNSTVSNLSNVVTNTQASRSRIMDADYATETTELARAQIVQQAATAMLAQANQSAQTVLSLLK